MGRIKETSRDSEAFGTGNGGELLPPLGLGSWKLWQEGCLSQGGTEGKHRQWPTLQWCRGGRGINTAASPVDFSSPADASHSLFFARTKEQPPMVQVKREKGGKPIRSGESERSN